MRIQVMVAALLGIAAASRSAHAMGVYKDFELVAWNDDGTSAIVKLVTTSSGQAGASTEYIVFGVHDQVVVASFHSTLDADTASEQVDEVACVQAVDRLGRILAQRRFGGVVLHRDRCKTKARDVVTLTPALSAIVAASVAQVGDHPDDTIATRTGALILVIDGENGDSSRHARVRALTPTKAGLVDIGAARAAAQP